MARLASFSYYHTATHPTLPVDSKMFATAIATLRITSHLNSIASTAHNASELVIHQGFLDDSACNSHIQSATPKAHVTNPPMFAIASLIMLARFSSLCAFELISPDGL